MIFMIKKKITVVIVTYKTSRVLLKKCLDSIDSKIKTIIIENSKKFNDKEFFIKKYNNLKIYCSGSNLGYGKGNNYGFRKVKTKYALVLNPDSICKRNFFENLNKILIQINNFHLIGCRYSKKSYAKQAGYFDANKIMKLGNLAKVDWIKGFSLIINFNKFKSKKIFDENYFLFFEEIDLCKSIKNRHGKVYFSKKLEVNHLGFKSSTGLTKSDLRDLSNIKNWHYMWSRFYFYKKNYGYFYSLKKNFGILIRSALKTLLYLLLFQNKKKDKYFYRLLGLCNSMLNKPSYFRAKNYY